MSAVSDERSARRGAWMQRVQNGDRDAYRALLDDIGPVLLAFLRRKVADPHDADDMFQDTLIALHRARHTYDSSRPLEPWLFAIARNVAADHHRRRLARLSWEVLVEVPCDVPADASLDERDLDEALRRLPPAQREAFAMLKLEGLSVEAGAARAGITPGALRVRAHRAYTRIKALLQGDR